MIHVPHLHFYANVKYDILKESRCYMNYDKNQKQDTKNCGRNVDNNPDSNIDNISASKHIPKPKLDEMDIQQIRYKLDESCKKLLSNVEILAWILKTCAEEYKDCDVKEIVQYIEGDPLIALVPVHQDETILQSLRNSSATNIKGSDTEDKSQEEGTIRFDIKFNTISPVTQNATSINLIINVECQNRFHVGYPIVKRGIYYCGRMLSAQYRTVFTGSEYGKLQKVYSIWICTAPPKNLQNSINLYSITETQLIGNVIE